MQRFSQRTREPLIIHFIHELSQIILITLENAFFVGAHSHAPLRKIQQIR
jgi:hypothetical protein